MSVELAAGKPSHRRDEHIDYGTASMIYAIVPFASEDDIAERIRDLDAPYFDKEAPKVLFVSFHGTAEELSRKLGLSKSGGGTGVVVSVARYHGFGRRSLWEWLERYDDAP